ncbi:MAG TPA: hypothetical protein VNA24_33725 [Hyalangium sp.]|nr:hypothetical protein [Hyalangium sp.]
MKLRTRRTSTARGQAMTEYVSITAVLLFAGLAAFLGWPFTQQLFNAMQSYIDLYFFALNLAIG